MGSTGLVTVVDADVLTEEDPPEKKVRLNNSLRQQLDEVVPLGTDLQRFLKTLKDQKTLKNPKKRKNVHK